MPEAAPVVGDGAVACLGKRIGLVVPAAGGERPPMQQDDGLAAPPLLDVEIEALLRPDRCHVRSLGGIDPSQPRTAPAAARSIGPELICKIQKDEKYLEPGPRREVRWPRGLRASSSSRSIAGLSMVRLRSDGNHRKGMVFGFRM